MGRKPKQYKYVKETDGRRNNKRKAGVRNKSFIKATSSGAINNAKRNRTRILATNAIENEFGSIQEFWAFIAKQARTSPKDRDTIREYAFGKAPDVVEDKQQKVNINIKNLFTGNQDDDNTIELDSNEDSSS